MKHAKWAKAWIITDCTYQSLHEKFWRLYHAKRGHGCKNLYSFQNMQNKLIASSWRRYHPGVTSMPKMMLHRIWAMHASYRDPFIPSYPYLSWCYAKRVAVHSKWTNVLLSQLRDVLNSIVLEQQRLSSWLQVHIFIPGWDFWQAVFIVYAKLHEKSVLILCRVRIFLFCIGWRISRIKPSINS